MSDEIKQEPLDEELIEDTPSDAEETDATETGAETSAEDDMAKRVEALTAALQRERADFVNFKKRIERESEGVKHKVSGDVLAKILPVIDDFERALGAVPQDEQSNDWMQGISLIHRKLQNLIDNEGIEVIDPLGEPFDPNFHEAIGADEPTDDIPSDHVTVVLQKGYKLGERVLRPAMVRVAN